MRQLSWPLDALSAASASATFARDPKTVYQIRLLRYWFCRCLLEDESRRIGRPLRVLEVGIDRGQMLEFCAGSVDAAGVRSLPDWTASWTGLDVQGSREDLVRCGYTGFIEANIEQTVDFDRGGFDAVILLHVLEHLADPEGAMARLADVLEDGGLMMGGSPTMPGWMAAVHQRRLRQRFADSMHDVRIHKHLSVISPNRVMRFAKAQALAVELLSGTFLLRSTGSRLEDSALWIRGNLLWGAAFPSLGGELYFAMRKQGRPGS